MITIKHPMLTYTLAFLWLFSTYTTASPLTQTESNHHGKAQVSSVWDFAPGTWAENLAVRPNGQILTTIVTLPQLWLIDPTKSHAATLIYTFPNVTGATGIAEVPPGSDIFYVATGSATTTTYIKGSWSIYRVDMTTFKRGVSDATVTKFVSIPEASLLNGIVALHNRYLLVADSVGGAIWRVNSKTADADEVSADPLLAPPTGSSSPIGVNGLKLRDGVLYWSNTAGSLLASAPVYHNGTPTASGTVLASGIAGVDDFALDKKAFLVAGSDEVRMVSKDGELVTVSNDTLLEGSTAIEPAGVCEFEKDVYYVTTNGGLAQYATGNLTNPGKVVRVAFDGGA